MLTDAIPPLVRSFHLVMTPYLLSEPDTRKWPVTTERDPETGLFDGGYGCFDECCNVVCRKSRGMPCFDALGHVVAPCPGVPPIGLLPASGQEPGAR